MDRVSKLRKITIITILFLIFFSVVGCTRNIEEEDVVGSYTANHGKGEDSLDIRADGTYSHTYKPNWSDNVYYSNSRWKLENDDGKYLITFYDYTGFIEGEQFEREKSDGLSPHTDISPVRRSLISDDIKITISPDSGYYFEKVD